MAEHPRVVVRVVAIQMTFQLPKRIQWRLRVVTTTVLLLGVLWQNGSWTVELSNALEPAGVKTDRFYGVLVCWDGVECCCCESQYSEKRNGSGLVFVRHSLLLLLCSVIVEALRYKDIDVSMYWQIRSSVGYLLLPVLVDLDGLQVSRKWMTPELGWTSHMHHELVSSRLNPNSILFDALEKLFGIYIQGT